MMHANNGSAPHRGFARDWPDTLCQTGTHALLHPVRRGRRISSWGLSDHIRALLRTALAQVASGAAQIAQCISEEPRFAAALAGAAAAPRPGTKTYARWKDALVGCFKAGRYPHFSKTKDKTGGLKVYRLEAARMPPKVTAALAALGAGAPASSSAGGSVL